MKMNWVIVIGFAFPLSLPSLACEERLDPGHPDWKGKIVGYQHPDYDPIYENLGPVTGYTPDGDPIHEKSAGAVYKMDEHGPVTGFTPDGDPLYRGETSPTYTYDGDRVYPDSKDKPDPLGWL